MANCIIHPIPLFQFQAAKSLVMYRASSDQQVTLCVYAWYIEGTEEKILVDPGGGAEYILNYLRPGEEVKDIQTLDSGLSKLGLSFSDIDLVIVTHLHFDHVAQASRFPKAKILIQREELEFAQHPHPVAASDYPKEFFEGVNFEVISGDVKICEGVSVLSTPGHSPGGQSVSINTAQGVAIIAGLCTIQENFEPPSPQSRTMLVTPPGVHINALQAYDSVLRIKEMADIIVPPHEPEFLEKSSIP